jgi:glucosylceramidase
MESLGFPIWAITTQNEPSMGLIYPSAWNALGWTPKHQVNWLEIDLIPIFKQNNISSKIIIFDDNRIFLPAWVDYILENEFVRNNTDGIARVAHNEIFGFQRKEINS